MRQPASARRWTVNAALLVPALCCAAFAFHACQTDVLRQTAVGVFVHVAAPLAACAVLVSALFLKPALKVRIAVAAAAATLSLWPVEAMLPPFDPARQIEEALKAACARAGLAYDERPVATVVRDLRSQGQRAVPSVHPIFFRGHASKTRGVLLGGEEVVPLGGVSEALTVLGNESGQYLIYASDEHGFHNPKGLYQPHQLDVAMVGDSFTQGCCVASDDNAAAVIRRRFSNTLNLGSCGDGPLSMLATIREYVVPLAPKVMVWLYYEGNDLADLRSERDSLLIHYLEPGYSANLIHRQAELDRALDELIEARLIGRMEGGRPQPSFADMLKLRQIRLRLQLACCGSDSLKTRHGPRELELFSRILDTAKHHVHSYDGRLYFVYLPEYSRYARADYTSTTRQAVKRIVQELGITMIDLCDHFGRHPDPLALFPFRTSGHYNGEGYALVGRAILQTLAAEADEIATRDPGGAERGGLRSLLR